MQFNAEIQPQGSAVVSAVVWVEALLVGRLGTSIAIIAIAFVGFQLLTGDLSMRKGLRVILGAFLLFGAPVLVRSLVSLMHRNSENTAVPQNAAVLPTAPPARALIAPTPFDPYAGAPATTGPN